MIAVAQTVIIRSTKRHQPPRNSNKDRKALEIRRDFKPRCLSVCLGLWVWALRRNPSASLVILHTRQMTTLTTDLNETIMDRSAQTRARIILRSDESSALSAGQTATAPAGNISSDLQHKCASRERECGEGVKFSCSPVGDWQSCLFALLRNHCLERFRLKNVCCA